MGLSDRRPVSSLCRSLAERVLGRLDSRRVEDDGFGLGAGIADQFLRVQPVQRIPIVPLPRPPAELIGLVQRQVQQRQHGFVDLVFVVVHSGNSGKTDQH
jgi:hypothetical protein